jgi:hypothetical protein
MYMKLIIMYIRSEAAVRQDCRVPGTKDVLSLAVIIKNYAHEEKLTRSAGV